jgi:O-antigen/teichoic acid export membrane protein
MWHKRRRDATVTPPGAAFAGRTPSHRLRRNAAYSLAGQVATVGAVAGTQFYLARILSPTDFGIFSVDFVILTFMSSFVRLGVHRSAVRQVAADLARGRREAALRWSSAASLAIAVLSVIAVPVLAFVLLPLASRPLGIAGQAPILLAVLALAAGADAVRTVQSEIFRGYHQIGFSTAFGTAGRAVLVLLSLFATEQVTSLTVLRSYVDVMCVCTGLLLAATWTQRGLRGPRRERGPAVVSQATIRLCGSLLMAGLPFLVTEVTGLVVTQGDVLIAGATLPHDSTAVYNAALRLVTLLSIPLFTLSAVLAPVVTDYYSRGQMVDLQTLLRQAATVASVAASLMFVGLVVWANQILGFLYGPFYASGGNTARLLAIGPLVNTLSGMCGWLLVMTGFNRPAVWITVGSAVLGLSLGVVGATAFGSAGLAAASSLATVLQCVCLVWAGTRKTHITTVAYLRPKLIARSLRSAAQRRMRHAQ